MSSGRFRRKPLIHYSVLGFMYAVGLVTVVGHTVLHASSTQHDHPQEKTSISCNGSSSRQHQYTFTDQGVSPAQLAVNRCDEVIVFNATSTSVEIAIGPHPRHHHYDGFREESISKGEKLAFSATQAGSFLIHDHHRPELSANLVVTE